MGRFSIVLCATLATAGCVRTDPRPFTAAQIGCAPEDVAVTDDRPDWGSRSSVETSLRHDYGYVAARGAGMSCGEARAETVRTNPLSSR
jgi:hypothetical protein